MDVIAYTITLEQPLLTTSLVGDPNSTVSYDYIPGSALRGLFASRFREGAEGADDALFQRLFLSRQVRFLNAYPVAPNGTRCLPTPRGLQQEKHDSDEMPVLVNRGIDPTGLPGRWKTVSQSFCALIHRRLHLFKPLRSVAIHVQRDRLKGKAWLQRNPEDDTEARYGTVFRYEALAAGYEFAALILIDPAVTSEDRIALQRLLTPETCWIGRSRSAGYGRARLAVQMEPGTYAEPAGAAASSDGIWSMTLLSPAILRSPEGEDIQQVDDRTLSLYLKCPVTIIPERTFTAVEMVGGFNRHWRLPVPQRRALAMGSVITFQVAEPNQFDPAELEANGIGDRRNEGFGRLTLNWLNESTYPGERSQLAAARSDVQEDISIPAALQPFTRRIANRVGDSRIDAAIITFVQRYVWPQVQPGAGNDRMPTNSQLSHIQTLVRQATFSGDTQSVLRAFLQLRDTARFGFERARLAENKGSLADWLYRLLEQPSNVWVELGKPEGVKIGNVGSTEDDRRTRQVALRLIAAVLAAPGQRRKGPEFSSLERRP
ncbi:MAG: hypothetical protein HC822_24300 [Oscillochloris sp.]|nr:hypothetical protein [Oscillochloris sp.]